MKRTREKTKTNSIPKKNSKMKLLFVEKNSSRRKTKKEKTKIKSRDEEEVEKVERI